MIVHNIFYNHFNLWLRGMGYDQKGQQETYNVWKKSVKNNIWPILQYKIRHETKI